VTEDLASPAATLRSPPMKTLSSNEPPIPDSEEPKNHDPRRTSVHTYPQCQTTAE